MKIKRKLLLLGSTALAAGALAVTFAVSAAPAGSTPKWYVGGSELSASESYGGVAEPSSMKVLGVTTKCEHAYYVAKIFNSLGAGKGELTTLPLYECSADSGCTLESIKAKEASLPWTMETVVVESKPYLVIKGVTIEASYGGGFGCALNGKHEVTGSVGGALENATQKVVFNSSTAKATGASLRADGFWAAEFAGTYTAEDVGPNHHGQVVEAK